MGNLYKKYGKGKIYLVTVILLITLNILISILAYKSYTSFSIDGQKFKYLSQEINKILFEDSDGNLVIVTTGERGYGFSSSATSISIKYEVKYKDKVIKVDSSNLLDKGKVITLSDGSEYIQEFFRIVIDNSNQSKSNLPFDVQLINNIEDSYDVVKGGIFIASSILGIPLIFLGLTGVIYPKELWKFKYRFVVSGGEPTDFALASNIIVGIMFLCLAFLITFFMINSL